MSTTKHFKRADYADCDIFLYKKGSGGEIVGVYNSIKDIEEKEKEYNRQFSNATIYKCLQTKNKYYFSLAHQCKVRPIAKPRK